MKSLFATCLNMFAKLLGWNQDVLYYLITKPLKEKVKDILDRSNAYDHILSAIHISKKLAKPGQQYIIVDVGGGAGTTAEIFQKHFEFQGLIFEPIQSNVEIIKPKLSRLAKWKVVSKALGSKPAISSIHVTNRVTSSSLLPIVMSGHDDLQVLSKSLVMDHTEEVEISTLDLEVKEIREEILILKLDVQGYELEVLKGAIESLPRTLVVVLEMSNHDYYGGAPKYYEVDEFLRKHNYSLFDLYTSIRDVHGIHEWDSIYVNESYCK